MKNDTSIYLWKSKSNHPDYVNFDSRNKCKIKVPAKKMLKGKGQKSSVKITSTIQVRVDDELKAKSDALFKDLGTDTTTAIRMFLTQALAVNGFPFEIKRATANPYETLTEHDLLDKLEKSRKHAAQGCIKMRQKFPVI